MSIEDFDDKPTPAQTPHARRSSKEVIKVPTPCPRCNGKNVACGVCLLEDGTNARYTSDHGIVAQWILKAAKADTDPAPPTERNDR